MLGILIISIVHAEMPCTTPSNGSSVCDGINPKRITKEITVDNCYDKCLLKNCEEFVYTAERMCFIYLSECPSYNTASGSNSYRISDCSPNPACDIHAQLVNSACVCNSGWTGDGVTCSGNSKLK